MDIAAVGTLVLGGGGLLTGMLALFSATEGKRKTKSETKVNNANAETLREKLFQTREAFWRGEVEKVKESFEKEVEELRSEVAWLRVLIEAHVPWDWEAIRQLKLSGIAFRDPPTLNYIKNKINKSEEK